MQEILILLEVCLEGSWLFVKNNARVTSKKKDNKWFEVAKKGSACGVECREGVEVREHFKTMRSDVVHRQQDMSKTGGGKPVPPVIYEDLILRVIGAESNLIRGIAGDE